MRIRPYLLITAALGCAVACSKQAVEGPDPIRPIGPNGTTATIEAVRNAPESRALLIDEPLFVGYEEARPATRTTLAEDWHTTKWSPTDQIAVWAADASSGNYLFSGTPFRRNNQIAENAAIFTGDLSPMPAGRYRYAACYPVPEADDLNGTKVTYTLPAVQDGTYHAELDVLTSDLVEGGSLTDKSKDEQISVAMHHRFHALRIRIPSGRNLRGKGVTRLLIDFPHEAVGTATFDLATPDAAPVLTGGGRRIELRFDRPFDASTDEAPQYVWVFVLPGKAEGAISFTPLFEDGFCAETLSAPLDKELRGGRVTPVNLTVPATEQAVTWLDFTIDHTQLGEAVNTLTVTAPEGAAFRHNASTATLPVSNGKCSVGYYGVLYPTAFQGAQLGMVYDSTHAVVSNTLTLPASLNENGRNNIAVETPWLYAEDFNRITTDANISMTSSPEEQSGIGLPGWYFGRYSLAYTGLCIVLRQYNLSMAYDSCISTPNDIFAHLKEGVSVSIHVTFRSGCSRRELPIYIGSTTSTKNENDFVNRTPLTIPYLASINQSNVATSGQEIETELTGITRQLRLKWRTNGKGSGSNKYDPIYIDDIRVSIVP